MMNTIEQLRALAAKAVRKGGNADYDLRDELTPETALALLDELKARGATRVNSHLARLMRDGGTK